MFMRYELTKRMMKRMKRMKRRMKSKETGRLLADATELATN